MSKAALKSLGIHESWYDILFPILMKHGAIKDSIDLFRARGIQILPDDSVIFKAFSIPLESVKVVILGQDPYPTPGNAIGLAFGVPQSVGREKCPKALKALLDSIALEYGDFLIGFEEDEEGEFDFTLQTWADQGVLLLNTALTVVANKPNSHKKLWSPFMEDFLQSFSSVKEDVVYLLLGNNAKEYKKHINAGMFVEGFHPTASTYNPSLHFPSQKVFTKVNALLEKSPIKWQTKIKE